MRQPKTPIRRVMSTELLACIVTVAVVHGCAGAGEGCGVSAYIDPGTGSFFVQVLIAGLTGAIYLLRQYWRNVKGYIPTILHKKRGTKKDGEY